MTLLLDDTRLYRPAAGIFVAGRVLGDKIDVSELIFTVLGEVRGCVWCLGWRVHEPWRAELDCMIGGG